jgi:hypothetical protein
MLSKILLAVALIQYVFGFFGMVFHQHYHGEYVEPMYGFIFLGSSIWYVLGLMAMNPSEQQLSNPHDPR